MGHPYQGKSSTALLEEDHHYHYWNPNPSKKQRMFAIIFFVLLLLVALSLSFVVFFEQLRKPSGKRYSFDDIFDPSLKVQRKTVRWIEPDGALTYQNGTDIYVQRLPSLTAELVVAGADIRDEEGKPLAFFDYWFSADEKYLLLATQREKVWRHSYKAIYYIFDFGTKKTQKLTSSQTQYATWAPAGHSLAYVVDNDIFILRDDLTTVVEVTNDGSLDVINGLPAWVYEEEVFGTNYALWWSTDAKKLAFLRSDETEVDIFYLTKYGKGAYPQNIPVKYPKPGFSNPTAELWVYDSDTDTKQGVSFDFGEESLIVQVAWLNSQYVTARLTNRVQNKSKFYRVDTQANLTAKLCSQQESPDGWVEYSELYLIPSSNEYLELVDHNGFNHIALYGFDSPQGKMVTEGDWEVTNIAGFHRPTRTAYYLSTESDETQRHLYSVNIDTGVSSRVRLTEEYEEAFFSASFSPEAGFYLLNYNGPNVPFQLLLSTTDASMKIVLEDNAALNERLSEYALPEREFFKVPIEPNGPSTEPYEINCFMLLPPDFDQREPRTYSVLHRVYGGPGSNLVQKTFNLDWHTYLSSSERYIVSMCDARGTGQKGNKFKHVVYKNLGELEAYDQIQGAKFVQAPRYTRYDNTIVWGWSYGGYLTSKILETGSGTFLGGIAVAPVTDWRFYDTVYTERYMLTPQENPEGYEKSAVRDYAKINGTDYLIVHGTADDNVHFQHALVLIDDLTQANVDFEVHIYTDSDHSINTGANTQRDLYRRFTEFLQRHQ